MPAPNRYLKTSEAAAYLGVTVRTLRDYVASGDLVAYRRAGRQNLCFKVEDLDALMQPTIVKAGGRRNA